VEDAVQGDNDECTTTPALAANAPSAAETPSSSVALTSLAPQYQEEHHRTYLGRLENAVKEPKNLNIALTGRYGAGKSSVLDKFEEPRKSTTLRLAISTLGPNGEGATLTNRIQKELVKQLVYSASPRTMRHSRFRRSVALPWHRALGESAAAVTLLGALLALLDWLPPVTGTGVDNHGLVRIAAWSGFAALLVAVATVLRLVTHDRFVVSDVSAGGATVKLSERTPTYFDEYLDDIVNYFDSEDIDIVIFEDLDRFNDPHIFEALRELNTLLNNTKKRSKKGTPLRFVYAVRDSLFEKLGADTEADGDDAAAAETVRANRTKFFDIVIPMVPFISHRNARDLLADLLKEAGISGIDRRLVNLVAQHSTDMRLLRNMRNEYLVFAERLLESNKVAPGLTSSNLFALVAYKNFHLEDFEQISRRGSDLDRLYGFRRDLVRTSVAALEHCQRDLTSGRWRLRTRAPLAEKLGHRLHKFAELFKAKTGHAGWPRLDYRVDNRAFTSKEVNSYEFWQATAQAKTVTVLMNHHTASPGQPLTELSHNDLEMLLPEGLDPDRWLEADRKATQRKLAEIDRDIIFLRSADFADLAANAKYTVSVALPAPSTGTDQASPTPNEIMVDCSFAELIDRTMKSELARDLVKSGYIDRNFALYAAQFYGHFTGTDVANFMVQNVQTNTMELDYPFTSPGAVANLLEEADDDFTNTVAAYNIDILNHLLGTEDNRTTNIVNRMVTDFDEDARAFLTAYLTSGAQRDELVAHLAAHPWHDIFTYLVHDEDIPDDARSALVDAALRDVELGETYDLNSDVGDFITAHYRDMAAFIHPHTQNVIEKVVTILDRAGVLIPDLSVLDSGLRTLVVNRNRYTLTAPNLRAALGINGDVSLDRIRENTGIYEYCFAHPSQYLTAVDQDPHTQHTVHSPQTLSAALCDVAGDSDSVWAEGWDRPLVDRLLAGAAPKSLLAQLDGVPSSTWPPLAEAKLFAATLTNFETYRAEFGEIDDHLAALLTNAGTIATRATDEDTTKETAAVALLNARTISVPAERVALARSLGVNGPLPVSNINVEASDLFALLLEHDLVADDATSFTHFHGAGWAAIGPAIIASSNIGTFLKPELVHGVIADLLTNPATRAKIGRQVVNAIDDYAPIGDHAALQAAAQYADAHRIALAPQTVVRIAQAASSNRNLLLRLLRTASPAAAAQHIVDVFVALGRPYSNVNRSGAEFNVDHDDLHEALLTRLQNENICTFRKKRGRNLYVVNIT
jgi:hypothetical protein